MQAEKPAVRPKNPGTAATPAGRLAAADLRLLLERSPAGFFRTTPDGRFVVCTDSCATLFGFSSTEEMHNHRIDEFIADPAVAERRQELLKSEGVISNLQVRIGLPDGSDRWLLESARRVQEKASLGDFIEGVITDITSLKTEELRLRRENQHIEQLLDNSPEAIALLDTSFRIQRVNREFGKIFGYTSDEALGRDIRKLIGQPEERTGYYEQIGRVIAGETVVLETKRHRKNGDPVEVSILVAPITTLKGEVGLYAIYREITAQKQAHRMQSALYRIAAKASFAVDLQELYRSIHEILQELMYARNCYIALHDSATDMVSFPYFVDEKDDPFPPHKFARGLTEYILRTGEPLLASPGLLEELAQRGEVSRLGSPSLDWMGVPLKDGDTTFGALVVQSYRENARYGENERDILIFVSQQIARAILHRWQQDAIRESENKFRCLAETAVQAILIYDGGRFLFVNAAAEALLGYSRTELFAFEDAWSIVDPDFRAWGREQIRNQLGSETHGPMRFELRITAKDGSRRWLDFSCNRIEFARRAAVVATAVDITQRKRGEQLQAALYRIAEETSTARDLNQFFRSIHGIVGELMTASNFYIALYDRNSDTLSFPYFVDEKDSRPDPVAPGKGLTEYVLRTGKPLLATPDVFQELLQRGEVERVGAPSVDWLGVPLLIGDTLIGVLVVQSYEHTVRYREEERDILTFVSQHVATAIEHKRNEEQLRASEARYRSLVESSVYGIYRAALNGRFLAANPALVTMLGYSTEQEVLASDASSKVYADSGEHEAFLNDVLTLQRWERFEARWRRRDGGVITVNLSGRLVRDEEGNPAYVEGIVEDITERRMLERQLRQAQKMEAVGRLAGGVAHDFNNLLTVIRGYTEMLQNEIGEADPRRNELDEIMKASDRAGALTRQLLAFSRQQVMAPRVLNLNEVVRSMENLLNRLLGEDIDLEISLGRDIGSVKADPSQIEQVIMNLAVNARDAMPMGGRLTIETADVVLGESWSREMAAVKPGPYVMLAMTDSGAGMDETTRSRVFEPFFTTKEQGKGTGLGLSTAYGIVKQSDGYIGVYSELGMGTTFKVYLPRASAGQESAAVPARTPGANGGSETILLVEDERGVRALVRGILVRNGYNVLETGSGEEALSLLQEQNGHVDLLLTDVVLPAMSGRELAERLRIRRPGLKVVYMSGYTDDAVVRHGVLTQSAEFLQKPFTSDALLHRVRSVLDRRNRT